MFKRALPTLFVVVLATIAVPIGRTASAAAGDPRYEAAIAAPYGTFPLAGTTDTAPAWVDLDGDGDGDLIEGAADGHLYYFLNVGTRTAPELQFIDKDLFGLSDVGTNSAPAFLDIDSDLDLDAYVGNGDGHTLYFENTGTPSSPTFAAPITDPFGLSDVGTNAKPSFASLEPGPPGLFVGSSNAVKYFRNFGDEFTPTYSLPTSNPFGLQAHGSSGYTFSDIDHDSDLDALVADDSGNLRYFENTGNANSPSFAAPLTNPFGLGALPDDTIEMPEFADVDGDSDLDVLAGTAQADVVVFLNSTPPTFVPSFSDPNATPDAGANASPDLVDIDNDGDLDRFAGNANGFELFYRNNGTPTAPSYSTSQINPFGLYAPGSDETAPAFVDIDADGDYDAFVGTNNTSLLFFRNNGDASSPSFALPQSDPFGITSAGPYEAPEFADVDGDGDLDLFIGVFDGTVSGYRNIGTAAAPFFLVDSALSDSFTDVGGLAQPASGDVDGDGDIDFLVGALDGDVRYFRNVGTRQDLSLEGAPPLIPSVGDVSSPALGDVDADGDLDAVIGNGDGHLLPYANVGNSSPTDIELSNNTVAEGAPIGTVVGTLSAVDPDSGDSIAFSLVSGDNDDDNGSFAISGDELQTADTIDFEEGGTRSVRIRATDSWGGFREEEFLITVGDQAASLSITDVTAKEGKKGLTPFVFTITRTGDVVGAASVHVATEAVTATAPSDFESLAQDLTFANGETTKTVTVNVVGDKKKEKTETFKVALSSPVGTSIPDDSGLGTIKNDDH